jgi:hypothetical protein
MIRSSKFLRSALMTHCRSHVITYGVMKQKVRLLKHEEDALRAGHLANVSHVGSSSVWLHSDSGTPGNGRTYCYRHMGGLEFSHLLTQNQLPTTQPYQTLTRNEEGRVYCESYLRTNKKVDTNPTTVVQFDVSSEFVDWLWSVQHKPEKGTLSHGVGDKAGKTLARFNEELTAGAITWRIVLVKRRSN